MRLEELIASLDLKLRAGVGSVVVTDLTDDSRQVRPGCAFVARSGTQADGRRFIADALRRGAAAVITDESAPPVEAVEAVEAADGDRRHAVAWVTAPTVDQPLAGELAERLWDRPSRKLSLIGITGTNGKTTTAFLIQHLFQQVGVRCGLIGTVWVDDGRPNGAGRTPAPLTTPGAIDFSRSLAAMVAQGCGVAVAELSSHGLHQGRAAALQFHAGVFTNLTGDHLDYHADMDDYADAKAMLFERLSPDACAVINADDPYGRRMVRDFAGGDGCVLWCTLGEGQVASVGDVCRARVLELAADHSRVMFDGPWGSAQVRLPLVGRHNVANALEALAAAFAVAGDQPALATASPAALATSLPAALASAPRVPGRLEPVVAPGPQPIVLVDYAHTHDALQNVLAALKPLTKGRLIVVFGCGGDRDRTKRPKMAAVACAGADRVVITSDNPRMEDPAAIIDDILAGVPENEREVAGHTSDARIVVEPDRARAIQLAIAAAAVDDVVLIAGKGHENYQIIGTQKRHFDDREQAAEALRARGGDTFNSLRSSGDVGSINSSPPPQGEAGRGAELSCASQTIRACEESNARPSPNPSLAGRGAELSRASNVEAI